MSSLPPGVTDSMCVPDDPPCGSCGHAWSDHLEEEDIVYDADGYVKRACNIIGCDDCSEFNDGEYEPEVFQEYD